MKSRFHIFNIDLSNPALQMTNIWKSVIGTIISNVVLFDETFGRKRIIGLVEIWIGNREVETAGEGII